MEEKFSVLKYFQSNKWIWVKKIGVHKAGIALAKEFPYCKLVQNGNLDEGWKRFGQGAEMYHSNWFLINLIDV